MENLDEIYEKLIKDKNNDNHEDIILLKKALLNEYYNAIVGYKYSKRT